MSFESTRAQVITLLRSLKRFKVQVEKEKRKIEMAKSFLVFPK